MSISQALNTSLAGLRATQSGLSLIAANVANEWHERARFRRPHDDAWLEGLQIDADDEPENAVERSVLQEHVRAAVQELPERQRRMLTLHVVDNLTYVDIANRLGLTRRMVKRDLALAYSRLRQKLGELVNEVDVRDER